MTGPFHRDWRTRWRVPEDGNSYDDRPRGKQIRDWLLAHPEVTSYAIVDDDSDMLPEQMPRFVQTGVKSGLHDEHANRIVAMLEGTA